MYWWRIDALRAELVAGSMTERMRFNYVMADAVSTVLILDASPWFSEPNRLDAVLSLISLVTTIGGTAWVFRLDGGGSGRNFLERYLALGFVVMIRVLAAAIAFMVAAMLVLAIVGHPISEDTGPIDFVVVSGWMVAFWVTLGREIRRVANASSALTSGAAGA